MPDTPLNPNALKDAAITISDRWDGSGYDGTATEIAETAIRAYLTVAQPEVNSVEELDALPMHTYVQGFDGFKHAKDWNGGWHLIVNHPSSAPHLSGSIELPARVLYRPEVNDGR